MIQVSNKLIIAISLFFLIGCSHITKQQNEAFDDNATPVEVQTPIQDITTLTVAQAPVSEVAKPETPSGPPPVYRLNIGDVLEISILDEPEMTRDVTIIPDGSLTYLLVGEVRLRDVQLHKAYLLSRP